MEDRAEESWSLSSLPGTPQGARRPLPRGVSPFPRYFLVLVLNSCVSMKRCCLSGLRRSPLHVSRGPTTKPVRWLIARRQSIPRCPFAECASGSSSRRVRRTSGGAPYRECRNRRAGLDHRRVARWRARCRVERSQVVRITAGSHAARFGIQPGDVIVDIGFVHWPFTTCAPGTEAVRKLSASDVH